MKRPPESAISESDLRQRIVQLEQIVEQQTARIAELERELARRKGRSRRGARAASSESGASSSPRTDASGRRSSGRSPGGQPGHEGHGRSWVSLVGIGGAGGRTDPGQAQPLPPMRAPVDGRRSSSAASPGSRHPAAAGRGHRVSGAHSALRSLPPPDRSRLARGGYRATPSVPACKPGWACWPGPTG